MSSLITYYLLDAHCRWTGQSTERSIEDPVPPASVSVSPPPLIAEQVAVWRGEWIVMDSGEFQSLLTEPPIKPVIVITEIRDNDSIVTNSNYLSLNTFVGHRLEFTAELRHPTSGSVLPINDHFRMPIRSRDGREEIVLAQCTQGIIRFGIDFSDSRVWAVTEDIVNSDLPQEAQMGFAGITIYVLKQ